MPRLLARRGGLPAALALSICALGTGSRASAQGITLDRYSPAETVRDGFALSRPEDRGHLRFGFDLHLDYANDPLVLELDPGDAGTETARVVSDHLVAHVGGWLSAANRLVFFVGLDVNVLMEGDSFNDPISGANVTLADDTSIGDARVGARLRLLGENDDAGALALQLTATLPLAEAADADNTFSGEDSVTLVPELLAEIRPGGLRFTFNAGIAVRKDQDVGRVLISEELRYGAGVTLPLAKDRLDVLVEVYGSTVLEDIGDREASPLEFIAGPKIWLSELCALGLAGGAGLQRGVGSPDFRAIGMFGCDLPKEEPPPEPEMETDLDGDGLFDREDGCPRDPEDRDDFEDGDGCPDPDNDKDGIPDVNDGCPLEPEDKDDFADENGCPDPDNDQDGLLDAADECPLEPEDKDEFEDENGCPDPDNDKDNVLDVDDKCPITPGVPEEHGCSKSVRVEEGRIVILERVEFATNKDVILERSEPVLHAVQATLAANPQIELVRIEGHTDSRGKDTSNMDLSRRRAGSVARWLREHGLPAERIEAYGCGESKAIDSNETDVGRQTNRRVEFHIIKPAPSTGVRSADGCEPAAP
jgi:outer membrane protein OmpA-like peptidoglycan-associated protein